MKRPGTLEVGDKLRDLKLFTSVLNNKLVSQWTEANYKEWECILSGAEFKPRKRYYDLKGRFSIKVLRVYDGKIFNSITECREHESFHKVELDELLKLGKQYKRIEP
tara:strand:+ start:174 stop:494 length:321 start_codon:yes stop_codon:yes gene_type:complete